jgi:flagellar hook-associated protein 3 FlgL
MVQANLGSIQSRTRTLEEQAVSGLAISKPSDAPELTAQLDQLSSGIADQSVFDRNATQSLAVLDTMDSALARGHDALTRVREIAVQMANGTMSADERAIAADEVDALRSTILEVANTTYAGRYVFAGQAYDSAAFADDGSYSGSTEEPSARVGQNTWVSTGRDGSEIFAGSIDILASLESFSTALRADDDAGIQAAITDIDLGLNALSTARTEVGNDTNVALDAGELAANLGASLQTRLDDLAAADPAETYMKLSEMRSAYTTALQVAASAKGQSLFDLL